MVGAGIVLVFFGIAALAAGRSLDRGGGDAFALAGLLPTLFGFLLVVFGSILMLTSFH